MKLYLIRHVEAENNVNGDVLGTDTPITEHGREQLAGIIETLRKTADSFALVISSGLERTDECAAELAATLGAQHDIRPEWGARKWGVWEDAKWEEVQRQLDTLSLEERRKWKPLNGESWEEVEARLLRAIARLRAMPEIGSVIVCTHLGCLRALLPTLLGKDPSQHENYSRGIGSVTIVDLATEPATLVEDVN